MTSEPTWDDFVQAVRARIARDLERERAAAEALRASLLPAVASALADARARGLVGAAWLFGSFAWGTPTERSDVDLLVEDCGDPDGLAAIVGSACRRDVHVVRRERAPASLVRRALADGRRV